MVSTLSESDYTEYYCQLSSSPAATSDLSGAVNIALASAASRLGYVYYIACLWALAVIVIVIGH